mmetsp:Transcript_81474/g.256923  ORF Transcript_81474/g.256923 Transcript_81474/m.256923 type:complete len:252 (+) Transcript_81474:1135-1890(+)
MHVVAEGRDLLDRVAQKRQHLVELLLRSLAGPRGWIVRQRLQLREEAAQLVPALPQCALRRQKLDEAGDALVEPVPEGSPKLLQLLQLLLLLLLLLLQQLRLLRLLPRRLQAAPPGPRGVVLSLLPLGGAAAGRRGRGIAVDLATVAPAEGLDGATAGLSDIPSGLPWVAAARDTPLGRHLLQQGGLLPRPPSGLALLQTTGMKRLLRVKEEPFVKVRWTVHGQLSPLPIGSVVIVVLRLGEVPLPAQLFV